MNTSSAVSHAYYFFSQITVYARSANMYLFIRSRLSLMRMIIIKHLNTKRVYTFLACYTHGCIEHIIMRKVIENRIVKSRIFEFFRAWTII